MNELSLVRLKIKELREELFKLEREEIRLVQKELAKENRYYYCDNGKNIDLYLKGRK